MQNLFHIIDKQINLNSGTNLFYGSEGGLTFGISKEILSYIDEAKSLSDPDKLKLIKYAVDKAVQEFCRINQYYNFTQQSLQELNKIYVLLFIQITSCVDSIECILYNHTQRLKLWLKQTNPVAEKFYSDKNKFIQPVACMEYSTEAQMEVLKIDLSDTLTPLLDIGCGRKNLLIDYLRRKGVDAYGVDRFDTEKPYVWKANWLEFDYGINQWQTIISNLGFSNHFIHHHIREDGDFETYAKKYIEILASLKIGGRFHYAPDLPFIEEYLDRNMYSVKKFDIINGFKTTIIERMK